MRNFAVTLTEPDLQATATRVNMAKLFDCFFGIFLLFATKGRVLLLAVNDRLAKPEQ